MQYAPQQKAAKVPVTADKLARLITWERALHLFVVAVLLFTCIHNTTKVTEHAMDTISRQATSCNSTVAALDSSGVRHININSEENVPAVDTDFSPAEMDDTDAIRQEFGLFVGVLSASRNFKARQAIRQTWGADARLTRVMFFILRPKSNATFLRLQDEAVEYGDIQVTSEIVESYNSITHSTLSIFRAAAAVGPQVKLVMKTDDDSYIRVPLLLEALRDTPREWLYAGWPMYPTAIPRPPGYWGIAYDNWPENSTVKYGWGAGYLLSVDLARRIAAGAPHIIMPYNNLVRLEDYAVGLWVDALSQLHDVPVHYHVWEYNSTDCDSTTVLMHWQKPADLRCVHANDGECCTQES